MGMTPQEYYCMTRAEFILKTRGFQKSEWKKWEHTRMLAYTTASTVPSKKRLPKMRRWMPLPTDEAKELGDDRIKELFKKLKKHDAKRK